MKGEVENAEVKGERGVRQLSEACLETISPCGKCCREAQHLMLKLYAYAGCSTCRNAIKWLKQHAIPFEEIAIRESPPSVPELRVMLGAQGGDLRKLFNTSGLDYRALDMKSKLPSMSSDEALKLLASNGNLVKRPFALDVKARVFLVGFKEAEWKAVFAAAR